MALGKRVFTQVQFILDEDDAIDLEASDYSKYVETLDVEHLSMKEGVTPTVFTLQPLTYIQRMHLEGLTELPTRCEFAIRCGLVGVDNYIVDKDGHDNVLSQPPRKRDGKFGELITKEWMSEANLPNSQTFNLAACISFISDGKRPLS